MGLQCFDLFLPLEPAQLLEAPASPAPHPLVLEALRTGRPLELAFGVRGARAAPPVHAQGPKAQALLVELVVGHILRRRGPRTALAAVVPVHVKLHADPPVAEPGAAVRVLKAPLAGGE